MRDDQELIREILEHALDVEPGSRAIFLDEACGDDVELRRRVEALLAAGDRRGEPDLRAEHAATEIFSTDADSSSDDSADRLRMGTVVDGKYQIDALLGAGGMGEVYRATDVRLERAVALKTIRGDRLSERASAERFRREAVAVARLRHPNIVTVHDYGTAPGVGAYLVMELLEGRSLGREIAERGRLDVATALAVAAYVCSAVGAAHAAGVVHRDLKPENVFVDLRGGDVSVKVVDFGLAKLEAAIHSAAAAITREGAVLGTPAYMSPEQCRGEEADARSDVYALGCVLYEALTGERPFSGDTSWAMIYQHVNATPRRPSELVPGLEPAVDEALMRALAKRPDDRYQTAEAFGRALAERSVAAVPLASKSAGNLPIAMTRFVGRERQIDDVRDRLRSDRLVTLVGPGGIGKSRLALESAAHIADEHADGAWFVELASLADPALVARAVASALDARTPAGGLAADAVARWLRDRRALLVLDTCEHVVDECARLVERWLGVAPGLRVLATSREPLAIAGESVYQVPALALPSGSADLDLACEAVRLFADRASLARPGFEATGVVAELCRRLEGIPLAIELAAARVRAIPVEQILERLDDRFRLLTGGSRGAPTRQQTLRATLDWSYNLLTDEERAALRRLSVFAGGWTLETAEAAADGTNVLDLLSHLVDKSLVTALGASPVERFRMLEVVREYGLERLRESGEEDEVARRHAEVFMALARTADRASGSVREGEWLQRLETERDNLRTALRWTMANDPDACISLAAALWNFWSLRGYFAEGERWTRAALEASSPKPSPLRAIALQAAGELAWRKGDRVTARARLEESMAVAREAGAARQVGWSAFHLALVLQQEGEPEPSRAYLDQCIEAGKEIGDERLVGNALNSLGEAARMEGDWATARGYYERSLEIHRAMGHPAGVSLTLCNLGAVLCDGGDLDAARACYSEAMPALIELGNTMALSLALDGLAAIAARRGEWARAARTAGAADGLRDEIGGELEPADRSTRERCLADVREHLGEQALASALAEGRASARDVLIEEAL